MARKIIDLYDKTGDTRFQTVEGMLKDAEKIEGPNAGIVILVEKIDRNNFHVQATSSNLDTAEVNLVLDKIKNYVIGPIIKPE
ncbi:MAG: hypothetical protein GOV02_03025 [Candidatus Aenigmarchaeota archaeon]|nr:hypothetical protein [Candidatus Aenigmarchaeota archaeon]